jgi:amino acid transporter
VAYFAITSIAVIGLYVAYVAPVFLRVRAGSKFKPGPWSLGKWGPLVGTVATIWVVVIVVLFMLPQYLPQFDANGPVWADLNFTPLVFLVVLGGAALWYAVSAKNWFKGPKIQGSADELAAIEKDLEVI